jgi:hypothetical protein
MPVLELACFLERTLLPTSHDDDAPCRHLIVAIKLSRYQCFCAITLDSWTSLSMKSNSLPVTNRFSNCLFMMLFASLNRGLACVLLASALCFTATADSTTDALSQIPACGVSITSYWKGAYLTLS